MAVFGIIGICLALGLVGAISVKYFGPDNEVEKVTEELIEDEAQELLHVSDGEVDPEKVIKQDV